MNHTFPHSLYNTFKFPGAMKKKTIMLTQIEKCITRTHLFIHTHSAPTVRMQTTAHHSRVFPFSCQIMSSSTTCDAVCLCVCARYNSARPAAAAVVCYKIHSVPHVFLFRCTKRRKCVCTCALQSIVTSLHPALFHAITVK
jgi:hypothetical protein